MQIFPLVQLIIIYVYDRNSNDFSQFSSLLAHKVADPGLECIKRHFFKKQRLEIIDEKDAYHRRPNKLKISPGRRDNFIFDCRFTVANYQRLRTRDYGIKMVKDY